MYILWHCYNNIHNACIILRNNACLVFRPNTHKGSNKFMLHHKWYNGRQYLENNDKGGMTHIIMPSETYIVFRAVSFDTSLIRYTDGKGYITVCIWKQKD